MSASGRPVRQIFDAIISRDLSPEARRKAAADFARARLAEAQAHNMRVTKRTVPYDQVVDGRLGAPLEVVNVDRGRIVFAFKVGPDAACRWISEQLVLHAPRLTGRFADSFRFYAGGSEVEPGEPLPRADEYVFLNTMPYSRKLERGLSHQAPDGLFQAVAVLASRRFQDVVSVSFGYRAFSEFGMIPAGKPAASRRAGAKSERAARTPAVIVRTRA